MRNKVNHFKSTALRFGVLAVVLWVGPTVATTMAGYETLTVRSGAYNLLSLRLHEPPVASGWFESISGATLSDSDVDFSGSLDPGRTYLVELEEGASNGAVLEVIGFSGDTLTVAGSLPAEANVSYTLREVARLSTVLGANAESLPADALVTDFNPDSGDLILLAAGGGLFDRYFYSSYPGLEGYYNAATGLPEDPLMWYTESFLYLRRGGTDADLVVTGDLKTKATLLSLDEVFNFCGVVYPVGMDFAYSNLHLSLQAGTAATADLVWMEDGMGGYLRYFYSDGSDPMLTAGWRLIESAPGEEDTDRSLDPIGVGMIIERRGVTPFDALLTPPPYYDGL